MGVYLLISLIRRLLLRPPDVLSWHFMPFILHNLDMKVEGLRRQLQEAEDALIKGRRELIEAHRELQECAQDRDNQRKEALDLRRLLGDETREKEAIQASNQELRALIKRAENDNSRYSCHMEVQSSCKFSSCDRLAAMGIFHVFCPVNFEHILASLRRIVEEREQKVAVLEECRSSVNQEATTLRSRMRDLEKSCLQARRELQELRRQVRDYCANCFPSDLFQIKDYLQVVCAVLSWAGKGPRGWEQPAETGAAGAAGPGVSGGAEGGGGASWGFHFQAESAGVRGWQRSSAQWGRRPSGLVS